MKLSITMSGEAISLKNSKRITASRRIIPSRAYTEWHERVINELEHMMPIGIKNMWEYPVIISFFFFRETRRKFDLHNMLQGPMDVLVELDIIEDDDMRHAIVEIDGYGWDVDKDNPRVEITIRNKGDSHAPKKESPSNEVLTRKRPIAILDNTNAICEDSVSGQLTVI